MKLDSGKLLFSKLHLLLLGSALVLIAPLAAQRMGTASVPKKRNDFDLSRMRMAVFNPREIRWGDPVENLQAGIQVDEATGMLGCWFRNASTNELTVCTYTWQWQDNYQLLQVRSNDMWLSPRKTVGYRPDLSGIGPRADQLMKAPAGAVLGRMPITYQLVALPADASGTLKHNALEAGGSLGPVHLADLLAFDMPADTLTQSRVVVRLVCQSLRPQPFAVVSAPVVIDGRALLALRAKGAAPYPYKTQGQSVEEHRIQTESFLLLLAQSPQKESPVGQKP